jgi:hypothetical protein
MGGEIFTPRQDAVVRERLPTSAQRLARTHAPKNNNGSTLTSRAAALRLLRLHLHGHLLFLLVQLLHMLSNLLPIRKLDVFK